MRASTLILVVAIGMLLGTAGLADAEKVRTNQSTKLYAGPGEQKKVLLKVKSGQNMTLLEQEGRWLKVRVQGRTGWVPRSKVDMADDGAIARNTRRRPFVDGRSKRRGFGGAEGPEDRIGADAVGEGLEDAGEEDEEEEEEPRKVKAAAKSRPDREDEEEEEEEEEVVDDEEEASAGDDEEVDEDVIEEEDDRPTARVVKRVSVFEDADEDSEEMFAARPADVLYVVETKGKWTAVENEEGDFGWIETEFLEMEGGAGGAARKRRIDVGARLGTMIIQQAMRTAGSTNLKVPDNYNIGTSSMTLSLGATFTMPFKATYILGAEAAYDFSKTLFGGITYDPPDVEGMEPTPPVTVGVTVHNINIRGMAGYDFKKKSGMAVFGRLGYRYQSFLIPNYQDPVKNPARIPQEVIKGPTVGAAFVMPQLTQKIGLKVALDTMLFGGGIKQTAGLEDGSAPTLKAITFGTGVTYKFKKTFDLAFSYDLRYMGIDFGPPLMSSMRGHMGNNVKRTDIFHMVTVGVTKPF